MKPKPVLLSKILLFLRNSFVSCANAVRKMSHIKTFFSTRNTYGLVESIKNNGKGYSKINIADITSPFINLSHDVVIKNAIF